MARHNDDKFQTGDQADLRMSRQTWSTRVATERGGRSKIQGENTTVWITDNAPGGHNGMFNQTPLLASKN